MRPNRICSYPGCPAFTPQGRCPEHQPQRPIDTRASSAQRGYDGRWKRYSREYREANPHCRLCLARDRRTSTALVDHIVPVTGPDDPLFWEPTNHQSLCRPCHAVKTKAEGRTSREVVPWFVA